MYGDEFQDDKIYDEINIVPMLDLSYVLMIIFVLMAAATIAGIRLDLPQASNRETLETAETLSISVLATGEIYLDGMPVSLVELERDLRLAYAANELVPIVVRGDGAAAYASVVAVLDVAKGVGISRIGLPTAVIPASER